MENIMDYINWYKNDTFLEKRFTVVDGLILAVLVHIKFENLLGEDAYAMNGITLKELSEKVKTEELKRRIPFYGKTLILLKKAAFTKRFGMIRLFCYETIYHVEKEVQFAAMTYELGDGSVYIAYRGTDDSIVGWKEDFNMGYLNPIPSQRIGVQYLETIARIIKHPIRVGGHSKGGNLAVYSSTYVKESVQNRILHVYSYDPPGFPHKLFQKIEYLRIADRTHKIMPSCSVVGLLLEQNKEFLIIKSNGIGVFQHDPFTWEIRNGKFIRVKHFKGRIKVLAFLLNIWFFAMTEKQREKMVNEIYHVLTCMGVCTLTEARRQWKSYLIHNKHCHKKRNVLR